MKLDDLKLNMDYFHFDASLYQKLKPTPLNNAFLISSNEKMFKELDIDKDEAKTEDFVRFVNGEKTLKGSQPFSMVYAGHQFGYFVPQLGDGRAINLGAINNWHLQTKGSGLTRYSRQGDGRAVLRSSIREYIMSEAMYALDIPTTRALALIGSTHNIHRSYEETKIGAVVLRISPSWVRFGTFEFFSRTKNAKENISQLCDYVIKQSYSHLENEDNKYEKMFYEVVDKTAFLLAKWQAYGFMHGVMNTDNMSIAGLTIDYGPFAFMDYFSKHNICNHTDQEGRYSYNNQPYIAKWNLEVLANTLEDVCDKKKLISYLDTFFPQHEHAYLELMQKRLGLDATLSGNNNLDLIVHLLSALENSKIDYNCFFDLLTNLDSLDDVSSILDIAVYRSFLQDWFEQYRNIINKDNSTFKELQLKMEKINPKYLIKNYMLQEAIEEAENGSYSKVLDLLTMAQNPFLENKDFNKYRKPTEIAASNLMLSCSS